MTFCVSSYFELKSNEIDIYLTVPLSVWGSDLIRVRSVVRVHPDPPFNPLKSILSESSEK